MSNEIIEFNAFVDENEFLRDWQGGMAEIVASCVSLKDVAYYAYQRGFKLGATRQATAKPLGQDETPPPRWDADVVKLAGELANGKIIPSNVEECVRRCVAGVAMAAMSDPAVRSDIDEYVASVDG